MTNNIYVMIDEELFKTLSKPFQDELVKLSSMGTINMPSGAKEVKLQLIPIENRNNAINLSMDLKGWIEKKQIEKELIELRKLKSSLDVLKTHIKG